MSRNFHLSIRYQQSIRRLVWFGAKLKDGKRSEASETCRGRETWRMEGEGGDTTGDKAKKRLKRTQRMEKLGEEGAECLNSKGRGKGNKNFKQQLSVFLRNRAISKLKVPEMPPVTQNEKFIACSKLAVDHYNKKENKDYMFVKILDAYVFIAYGLMDDFKYRHASWLHVNFEAKPKNAGAHHKPLTFFAEVLRCRPDWAVTACTILKPGEDVHGCGICSSSIRHPSYEIGGYRVGNWPRQHGAVEDDKEAFFG